MAPVRLALPLALAICLSIAAPAAAGPLDHWGAEIIVSTWNCPSFCQDSSFGPPSGGEGQYTAFSMIDDTRGLARGSASLDPAGGVTVPILQGEARSNNSGFGSAFSTSAAAEAYVYTGSTTATFDLDITLTAEVFDPSPNDFDTFVRGRVYIFETDGFFFTTDISTLLFESSAVALDGVDLRVRSGDADAADATRMDTLSFTLDPGDTIYVYAHLDAEAQRELSFADAFSTLTTEFQDATGLESQSVIPEPGTAGLLGLGLLALARARRRAA